MSIEAIIFDIGEVVLNENVEKAREIMCQKFNINSERFKKFVMKNILLSYSGMLHYNDFFKKLIAEEKLKAEYSDLVKEWVSARRKTSRINLPVKRLITDLSGEYVLVAFTDSTLLDDGVREEIGVYGWFDVNLISYREGANKKEPKFYQILAEKLKAKGIQPQKALYIDDKEENLEQARKFLLGIRTILYENNAQLKKDLKMLGVEWK